MNKCEICHKTKMTKKICSSVNRKIELLKLIHSNLGDLKRTMTRGGKNYYVTFIDEYSRYEKVHLLINKGQVQ